MDILYTVEETPPMRSFLKVFFLIIVIMNALYSVKSFLLSIDIIIQDSSWLPCRDGEVRWFLNIGSSCIPGINPT